MTEHVAIAVLGGFSVSVDGSARGPSIARRLGAIVGILAVAGERGVSRERLLALLWADAEPERARHALTQSLYALRRVLGVEDAIVGTAQLALNPARVSTDVDALEGAMRAGDVSAALALPGGPLLDGFVVSGAPEFERWLEEQRSALGHRVAAFLDARARAMLAEGDAAGAVTALRRRVALDPLDASATLELLRAMAQAGDTPGAVQHARVYAQLVRQELDLEPDPRVAQLADALRDAVVASVPSIQPAPSVAVVPAGAGAWSLGVRVRGLRATVGAWWRGRSRRWRRHVRQGALTAVAGAAALLAVARLGATRRERERPVAGLAVLPFRADGVSPDLAFLSAGMPDLLAPALAERDTVAVVDPAQVHRWHRALGGVAADSLPLRAAPLGARSLVTGTLVGNAGQLVVRATLVEARHHRPLATAVAHGRLDELPRLVERLATQLVAGAAGAGAAVGEGDVDPRALRAFLEARAAYAAADFPAARRAYGASLAADSSLGAAAVGLALAADWLEDAPTRDRALDLAARAVERLPAMERRQLVALRGARWPEPARGEEYFAAWEQVAREAGTAGAWVDVGRRYLVDGAVAGVADSESRARAAIARALAIDPADVGARATLRALDGAPDGEAASLWARWRRATRDGDARELARVRASLGSASDDELRRIARDALAGATTLADGWSALEARRTRAGDADDRVDVVLAEHAYALNAGHVARALSATRRLGELLTNGASARLQVLDALYGDGDSTAARDAVAILADRVRRDGAHPSEGGTAVADRCVLAQWSAWHGDTSALAATRLALGALAPPVAGPVGAGAGACLALVEAIVEGLAGSPAAGDALVRAEQLAMAGPSAGDLRHYAPLALAMVRERRGEVARARELLQRRGAARGWPRYLSSYLALDAALAERAQDTAGATAALRQYLALRESPDAPVQRGAARARERLRALGGER